uniref:THAP-type domain-containing protein n=1 Tax=Stegastes partitus TaxID=144197 RepID=A0A3B4ZSY2_9TELE
EPMWTCSVFGCKADKEVVSLHVLPKDLNIRMKWVHFIWKNRNIPTKLPDKTRVCSSHFPEVLFSEVLNDPGRFTAQLDQLTSPEPLCTQPKKSDREEAIAGILSRFSCPGKDMKPGSTSSKSSRERGKQLMNS